MDLIHWQTRHWPSLDPDLTGHSKMGYQPGPGDIANEPHTAQYGLDILERQMTGAESPANELEIIYQICKKVIW